MLGFDYFYDDTFVGLVYIWALSMLFSCFFFCGVASYMLRCSILFGRLWLGLEDGGCL